MKLSDIEIDLYAFSRNIKKLEEAMDELEKLKAKKALGFVKSPTIKSQEEAKYTSGSGSNRDTGQMLLVIDEKIMKLEKEIEYLLKRIKPVERLLQKCTDEEVELLELRYMKGWTLSLIAKCCFKSHSNILRKLQKILKK